ncbi:MAG: haloacid dehalogenase type II [Actinomycetota bacterium]|uniref:Haloacid dehalogenase type II n=1 Tax=Mycobacterium lentiflavum TaxID=141349 RepID=A0ABY3UTG6_MYCLN|nr:haloacid dehalogenase type II [Mycobacterium lentiflavum]MEE3064775.1 haloacid dehalogenase type II [Actinomycetota bacterium]ULP41904.1 haloacid dehalogenase type II [Mycobacterium lentiflavum]
MPTTPSVLIFDVNETLIDIDSLAPLFGELFGDQRVLREWFGQLVTYSMTATMADCYVDFFTLGRGVLHMLADSHGVQVTDADAGRLQEQMRTMPAHHDAAESLATLRDNGFRLVTLTNSPHRAGVTTPLDNAGLASLFDRQLSVESCRAFKPSPVVYRHACEALGVAPADCMMVAAHVWDLLGAQNVGLSSALVTRPGNSPLRAEGLPQPTLVVKDLHELASQLITKPS